MALETAHIAPLAGERPTQYAERVGKGYAEASIQKDKKHKGQFFTPLAISAFMGGLATPSGKKDISVLDPGCGKIMKFFHFKEPFRQIKKLIQEPEQPKRDSCSVTCLNAVYGKETVRNVGYSREIL